MFALHRIHFYFTQTSQIPIQHIMINTTSEQIQAMQLVRESVQATNFSHGHDYIAIFSPDYVSWTANKVRILIFCSIVVT